MRACKRERERERVREGAREMEFTQTTTSQYRALALLREPEDGKEQMKGLIPRLSCSSHTVVFKILMQHYN